MPAHGGERRGEPLLPPAGLHGFFPSVSGSTSLASDFLGRLNALGHLSIFLFQSGWNIVMKKK